VPKKRPNASALRRSEARHVRFCPTGTAHQPCLIEQALRIQIPLPLYVSS